MRRASFWFTATTVDTVPTATHNTTLSPASRALERGRSVREYPTHVSDPMSSLGHAVWRFLLRRAAGRYAEHDLRAFHWLCYLLGQPRFSESFSRGAPRGSLWVRQGPSFRSAFLGRIACPTATTTAATSLSLASKHIAQAHGEHTSNGAWQPRAPGPQFSALSD